MSAQVHTCAGGGCSLTRLPEVLGQLGHEVRLLFLHVLQSSVVGVADFHACAREPRFPNRAMSDFSHAAAPQRP